MKKILFVSTTLGNGGAERIMLYLMNYLIKLQRYEISLLLLRSTGNDYLPDVSSNVKIYQLKLDNKRVRFCILPILQNIYRINPDICFIGHVELNILIAPFIKILPSHIKFITRETSILSIRYKQQKWKKLLYYLFYRNYQRVIAQSNDMRNDLINHWFVSPAKCIKINNPIDFDYITKKSKKAIQIPFFTPDTFNLIAIGKLDYQKGYDILLTRLSELENKNFKLIILGKGKLYDKLQNQIQQLNLADNVKLEGFSPFSSAFISQANGLILASRFEGFPNVLLEATALGKPVFSNNCMGGINEIILPGINGYTADFESPTEFSRIFKMFKETKFNKSTIIKTTKERYAENKIMPQYEMLFKSIEN